MPAMPPRCSSISTSIARTARDVAERVPDAAVRDMLDDITASHDNVWLSFDNLAPNGHALDSAELAYNLLPIAGSSHEAYVKGLGSDRRRALEKALRETEQATEEIIEDRTAIREMRLDTDRRALPHPLQRRVAARARGNPRGDFRRDRRLPDRAAADPRWRTLRLPAFLRDRPLALRAAGRRHRPVHDQARLPRADPVGIRQAGASREVDAASAFPFLKRQMGFAPVEFPRGSPRGPGMDTLHHVTAPAPGAVSSGAPLFEVRTIDGGQGVFALRAIAAGTRLFGEDDWADEEERKRFSTLSARRCAISRLRCARCSCASPTTPAPEEVSGTLPPGSGAPPGQLPQSQLRPKCRL